LPGLNYISNTPPSQSRLFPLRGVAFGRAHMPLFDPFTGALPMFFQLVFCPLLKVIPLLVPPTSSGTPAMDPFMLCCEEGFRTLRGGRAGACISSTKSAHEQVPEDRRASSQQSNHFSPFVKGGGGRDRRVARQIEPFRDYERRECLKHALHRRGHHFEVQLGGHSGCVRSRSQRLTVCWRRNSGRRVRVSIVIAPV
jgi:hypothetical protein